MHITPYPYPIERDLPGYIAFLAKPLISSFQTQARSLDEISIITLRYGSNPPLFRSWHELTLSKDNVGLHAFMERSHKRVVTHRGIWTSSSVNRCWPSAAKLFLVSGPIGTHNHIFILSRILNVLKRGLLLEQGGDYYWSLPLYRGVTQVAPASVGMHNH